MTLKAALSWTVLSVLVRYGIKLVGNLTLARLLTPEDFGLSAIVLAVVTGIEAITDVGTKPALIRTHRNDDAWLDTAWTLGVVRGFAIAVAITLAAVPLAVFFKDARLATMIAATATMSVLIGVTSITSVTVVRDLQLKQFALLEIFSAIAGYVIMLVWAWVAPSAWALLAGAVISTGTFTVASYSAFGRRPVRFHWDRGVVAELVGFGRWVFLASLLGFLIFQGDRFGVAKLVGVTAAGLYAIAATWSMTLQSIFGIFLSRLYLPVAAQLWRQLSGNRMLWTLRRSVLFTMIVPFAFAAGCSNVIIDCLYPEIYAGAGPVMCVLVIGGWFSTLEYLYNDQLMISGEPRWRFIAQIASAAIISIGLLALMGNFSTVGIAIVFSGGALTRALILMYACDRSSLKSGLPDLALTGIFIGLSLLFRVISYESRPLLTPFLVLLTAGAIALPPAAWISLRQLKRILQIADASSVASPNSVQEDISLDALTTLKAL